MTKSKFSLILLLSFGIIPIFTLMFAGTTYSATQSAFSKKKLYIYQQAARQYWQRQFFNTGLTIPESTCPPERVTYDHVRFDPADYAATAWLGAAWPPLTQTQTGLWTYPDPAENFCNIRFNRNNLADSQSTCIAYIHEYGHLLGYRHNNANIYDVMYQGYTEKTNDDEWLALQDRWKAIQMSKSVCRRIKGDGT